MINLLKADLKSIKSHEYIILVLFVFILAFLVNPGFIYPYYMWIFYFTFALCASSMDQKRKDKVLPVIISLPINRKEYIGAKYFLAIVGFLFSTIVATIIGLFFDWKLEFFRLDLLVTAFLLLLLLMSIFIPLALFYKSAGFVIPFIFIFCLTIWETSSGIPLIRFHPSFLFSIIIFYLSYLLSVRMFERKRIN
ncbi:ABC-2 transporter permease [Lederbergia panacisoli]|uniref:ABC-2 transporter permease n=1 Tax=Lederbergia panacisoli TaxID=1255251 RepID=UPI00214C0827|nr:ABC-2 transporter permease [Lederbergia panacisoli]MCR2822130.1 ABC-2 transporter permease [Lederbergia panacisoli]